MTKVENSLINHGVMAGNQPEQIAKTIDAPVLSIIGRIDGDNGYPAVMTEHQPDLRLITLRLNGHGHGSAIYEIRDMSSICPALDALEEHGGYRYMCYDKNGRPLPNYCG